MNPVESSKKNSPWFLLWFPPVLFFLVITIFSIYFGMQAQRDTTAIAEKTSAATPYILLTVQALLLAIQFVVFRRQSLTLRDLGWQAGKGKEVWKELGLGAAIGAPFGFLWIFAIEPILAAVQSVAGDYVPAGSLFPALGSAILPFAAANVLLAPFVEENIYRGYGVTQLLPRFGARTTIILSSLCFGLLHWSGGFWYILITTFMVGVPFAILRLRRGNILVPFSAHFALNLVETLLLWTTLT
jgi:membrane protease YdiL (CAAX protease family)